MMKTPDLNDRRFAAPEWTANPLSAFSAASYLLNSHFLIAMAEAVEAAPREKQKIRFAVQQWSTPCRRRISWPPIRKRSNS